MLPERFTPHPISPPGGWVIIHYWLTLVENVEAGQRENARREMGKVALRAPFITHLS